MQVDHRASSKPPKEPSQDQDSDDDDSDDDSEDDEVEVTIGPIKAVATTPHV